ncbi:MAG: DNRLRE domain-containing protein [Bacillota bacterium]|nr:DNRLRE domain-containing protein [Bacillota bacterium]
MKAPVMYDSLHEDSNNIKLSLEKSGNGYELTISPDKEWLNDPSRKFPITIDPDVFTSTDVHNIQDAHVSSGLPTDNFYQSYKLKTGYASDSGVNYTYISFDLPTLGPADMVTDAVLGLGLMNDSGLYNQVNVHKVTEAWTSSGINWAYRSNYNPRIEDYTIVHGAYEQMFTWDVTSIVKDWYSTGNNYGLLLKNNNDSGYCEFFSSDTNSSFQPYRPEVAIRYVNNSGIESYWTYHSQDVGKAGTGYVNDYNGNVVFEHEDYSLSGNRMPINIKHIFNNNQKSDIGYGYGWRLNLSQKIDYNTTLSKFSYTDEDGTIHYFTFDSTAGLYKDDSGIDLTMSKRDDSYYVVKDKKDSQLIFRPDGWLDSMKDNHGNTMVLGYDGTTLRTVKDGSGRVVNLFVDSNRRLQSIVDWANRTVETFQYEGSNGNTNLRWITYLDGNNATFNYDSHNNLYYAANYDGSEMIYYYYDSAPYRVKQVLEANTNGTLGQTLNMSYGQNSTTFTDVNGKKNVLLFNNWGNTICTKDNDGSAQYYKFTNKDNGDNVNNKLSSESKLQKSVINYLRNHNAEVSSDWTSDYWGTSTGTSTFTTEDKYMGNSSLKVQKTNTNDRQFFTQTLNLQKGKTYTYSAYVKTTSMDNVNGTGAFLFAIYKDGTGTSTEADSTTISSGTSGWQRIECTFTIPSNATDTTVYARAGIVGEKGTAYFDCLQVEDGNIANRYNLVENADFSYGSGTPAYWQQASNVTDSADTLTSTSDSAHPSSLDSNVYLLNGGHNLDKELKQKINVSGDASSVLVVGGWAKGNGVSSTSSTRRFGLCVGLADSTGVFQWKDIPFNVDSSDWQYISDVVVANKAYTYMLVYVIYQDEANSAYFDGVQAYKDEFGQSYQYDSKGNVVSTASLASQNSKFDYNGTNDLLTYTDPKSSKFTYTYSNDGKHDLMSATSAENIVYSFGYDQSGDGNVTSSRIGSDSRNIKASATYTDSGNYVHTMTNNLGYTTTYIYDEAKGLLSSETDPNQHTTSYGYDNLDRMQTVSKSSDGVNVINSYTYKNDNIDTITHNGFSYSFGYDFLGNNTTVNVGTQNLITNNYEARTSKLLSSVYGNCEKVSIDYDDSDRVIDKKFDGSSSPSFVYGYDASGNLGYKQDIINNINYRYIYDTADRLVTTKDNKGNVLSYTYDLNNNINSVSDTVDNNQYATNFTYDKDNRTSTVNYTRNGIQNTLSYNYDLDLGILKDKTLSTGTFNYKTSFTYKKPGGNGGTDSTAIDTISNNGNVISYDYDANGNIADITQLNPATQKNETIQYYYNELNELIQENNPKLGKTIVYTYDAGGNTLTKTEYTLITDKIDTVTTKPAYITSYNYTYGDSNWKDKLTSYNGKPITYATTGSDIGNPLKYDNWSLSWEHGRQLASMNNTSYNISYKYNDDGIRTSKTVNGVTTNYHLNGDKVTYESNGTDKIYYTYDGAGKLVSMNLNGVEYYYIRNAQGDIIGLFDKTGTQVVSYTYDSWGKPYVTDAEKNDASDTVKDGITGTLASTVGVKNPYRYRGYRYDTETQLYYLQSRYYNADWCRFINADGIVGQTGKLLDHNLFAYCGNNPIMRKDPAGLYSYYDDEDGPSYMSDENRQQMIESLANSGDVPNSETHYFNQMAIDTDGGDKAKHQGEKNYNPHTRLELGPNDDKKAINADHIHYIVLPGDYKGPANYGDIGVVRDLKTGKFVYAICGDLGPDGKYHEVSLCTPWDLGLEATPYSGPEGNFQYIVFPGTKQNWKIDNLQSQIDEAGKKIFP